MGKSLLIFIGVFICTIANLVFAIPSEITAGGITGISTLLYFCFKWNVGIVYFLLNAPLFLIAWRISKPLFYRSIAGMLLCSFLTGLLQPIWEPFGITNIWLGSLIGGLVMGLGIGLLGYANTSLGGGSMAGLMLHTKLGFSFSLSTMIIDASVFPIALFSIGGRQTLFSLLFVVSSALGVRVFSFLLHWFFKSNLSGDIRESA